MLVKINKDKYVNLIILKNFKLILSNKRKKIII